MKTANSILFTILLLAVCSITVFAQKNNPKVLRYFAVKYPAAAKAVRASGTVTVAVKIDKDGKVISSIAENGHPLLRKASENAAKEWIFSTDSNSEERETKITFSLRIGDKNKKDKVKFRKPYTLEITVARVRILDTISYSITR